jgi:hypothetical protein
MHQQESPTLAAVDWTDSFNLFQVVVVLFAVRERIARFVVSVAGSTRHFFFFLSCMRTWTGLLLEFFAASRARRERSLREKRAASCDTHLVHTHALDC